MAQQTDWNTGDKNGLVDIGTTRLYLQVCGPDRIPNQTIVLIIPGLGCCASSWAAVVRLLRPHMRVVIYDRAGLGKSEPSQRRPNMCNILRDLKKLLEVTHIKPPFLIIAHSWGGVLAQQFIATSPPGNFSGLVLVEANNEHTLKILDWRVFVEWVNLFDIDYPKTLRIESRHRMLPVEWTEYLQDENGDGHKAQAKAENAEYALSFPLLAANHPLDRQEPLLGAKPVSILVGTNGRDLSMMYDTAVSRGFGTPDEVAYFKRWAANFGEIDFRLQSEATKLSTNHKVVQGPENSGHNPHLTEPDAVAELVKSTMSRV
ncbi:hypothetical protein ONS95_003022 [Cadophora gregata]|uniref:uncharacterized protein n=1 Tax=Cadophora gregata TaxID=51156 RepID=UPI0026DC57D7|nr:uncharacterized protein ONS95_003022 [Cadophora gregata]KAK0108200.1 hypothetical protein ONS95_003022 [Cadophora gregata]KAK0109209.1 hypothetical protein ONS96_003032 [Cadophora gregata f. sp. sojae]